MIRKFDVTVTTRVEFDDEDAIHGRLDAFDVINKAINDVVVENKGQFVQVGAKEMK
jgi:hypothetical protein